MESFKDADGGAWLLSINPVSVDRCKAITGVDLFEFGMAGPEDDPCETLAFRFRAEPLLTCRVLWALCLPAAEKQGLDEEAFTGNLHGDSLWGALEALEDAIINFTPSPDLRATRAAALAKLRTLLEIPHQTARKMIEDPRLSETLEIARSECETYCGNLLELLESRRAD